MNTIIQYIISNNVNSLMKFKRLVAMMVDAKGVNSYPTTQPPTPFIIPDNQNYPSKSLLFV